MTIRDQMLLRTERLTLIPASTSDVEDLWPHVSDPEISVHMSWEPHKSKDETQAFLEHVEREFEAGRSIHWVIRGCDSEVFCGFFSIINIARKHRALTYNRGELAYWCARSQQGKGIMTEAGKAVVRFAFDSLRLNRLVVGHHLENDSSKKLIQRLGFKPIGIEHQAFKKHSRWIDIQTYELIKPDNLLSDDCPA